MEDGGVAETLQSKAYVKVLDSKVRRSSSVQWLRAWILGINCLYLINHLSAVGPRASYSVNPPELPFSHFKMGIEAFTSQGYCEN